MKTINFKDSYSYLKYLYESKLLTGFSKEDCGMGFSVSNDLKLEDEKTLELMEIIEQELFYNDDYDEFVGSDADFELMLHDGEVEMKSINSTCLSLHNSDVVNEVNKCFVDLFRSELNINVFDEAYFDENYTFTYELEVDYNDFAPDKIIKLSLYSRREDKEVVLSEGFAVNMFDSLREVLIQHTLSDRNSYKTFKISEDSVDEEFEEKWNFDFLKDDGITYTLTLDNNKIHCTE